MRQRFHGSQIKAKRRPFWLPASSFYFLVAGFAAASFFLLIGLAHDDGSEPEIAIAGLVSSGVLIFGVVLREIVLRNAREKFIADRNTLDFNLKHVLAPDDEKESRKFTLEQNAAAIESIRRKSEAAKVFGRISGNHREVFEMCAEYRRIVGNEMRNIHPNSPRLKALIKGNEFALRTHKLHLLRWAELESKTFAIAAQNSLNATDRTEYTEHAKAPLQVALDQYPDEPALKESLDLLDELLISMKLNELVNGGESALAEGDRDRSRELFENALAYLDERDTFGRHSEIRIQIENAIRSIDAD